MTIIELLDHGRMIVAAAAPSQKQRLCRKLRRLLQHSRHVAGWGSA